MASHRMQLVQDPIIPHIANLIRDNPGTISLGQGVVHYGPPPETRLKVDSFWDDPKNHLYSPVGGIPALKETIKQKLLNDNDIRLSEHNDLVVTAGANMAFLNTLFAITEPGDEVILMTPYYFNHEMAITMLGCKPVCVAVDAHYHIDLQKIQDAITPRTRAIVTVSPNNPTGAVYSRDALTSVNQLCAKVGCYHISDEAYEYFTYSDATHWSPGSLSGADSHTISMFSLSKSYGFAGWRIGYMVFPTVLATAIAKAQDTNLICPTVASQFAAIGALDAGRAYPSGYLPGLTDVRQLVLRSLLEIPEQCSVPPPEGAFYVFLKINAQLSSLELTERLIREYRIAVIPGTAFGISEGCYLRIAYGALQKSTVTEGISRLVEGLRALV